MCVCVFLCVCACVYVDVGWDGSELVWSLAHVVILQAQSYITILVKHRYCIKVYSTDRHSYLPCQNLSHNLFLIEYLLSLSQIHH